MLDIDALITVSFYKFTKMFRWGIFCWTGQKAGKAN